MVKNYDLFIFDLDGTLADTLQGIIYSIDQVLQLTGYPRHDDYTYFIGHGLRKLAENTLPTVARQLEVIENNYQLLLKLYAENYQRGLRLYDGIEETLDQVVMANIRLAVNTNKAHELAVPIINQYFGKWPFEMVVGAGCQPIKPNPFGVNQILAGLSGENHLLEREKVLYIGDSEVDIWTAEQAGVDVAACCWGFRTRQDLVVLKPTYLLTEPKQLLELIK